MEQFYPIQILQYWAIGIAKEISLLLLNQSAISSLLLWKFFWLYSVGSLWSDGAENADDDNEGNDDVELNKEEARTLDIELKVLISSDFSYAE